jgi:hypothetical protein
MCICSLLIAGTEINVKVPLLEMPVANRNLRAAAALTAVTSTGPKVILFGTAFRHTLLKINFT